MDNAQNNIKHFAYFYFNREEPVKIKEIAPAHAQYWKAAKLQGYLGGPFADRTGGLISFMAPSLQEATEIIQQDPFIMHDLIAAKWIKEWIVE